MSLAACDFPAASRSVIWFDLRNFNGWMTSERQIIWNVWPTERRFERAGLIIQTAVGAPPGGGVVRGDCGRGHTLAYDTGVKRAFT